MVTTSRIIETAPLYGLDLTDRNVILPHTRPAPVVTVPVDQLDRNGVLTTEPNAAQAVKKWKSTGDYPLPALLDPSRADMAGARQLLADESVEIMTALQRAAEENGSKDRGFQRKTLYVSTTGEFRVPVNIPKELETGPFQAGQKFRAIVRFSSAGSKIQRDTELDQRAVGIRITDDDGHVQDLTFTSGAAGNHARDARQFNSSMRSAIDMLGGGIGGTVKGLVGLLGREGLGETMRLAKARKAATSADISLAAMTYYSRSPIEMGGKLVHLALVPVAGTDPQLVHEARGARDGLSRDLCMRRTEGDIRYRIVAAEAPGLDDMSIAPTGPWVTVGEVRLPKQKTGEAEMLRAAAKIHGELAMHPFNTWGEGVLTARGELNEILRKPAYSTSALNSGRNDNPPKTPQYRI